MGDVNVILGWRMPGDSTLIWCRADGDIVALPIVPVFIQINLEGNKNIDFRLSVNAIPEWY